MHKSINETYHYESKDFYNDYCSSLEDFTLLEYFEDKDNKYVGKIAPNTSIHPIEIEVRIPHTFPHCKLLFVTWCISGYPHLIPFDKNNLRLGSWFCLNTAFAETPKAQLDEEFYRLRGWLRNNLRKDLPCHIYDREIQGALQVFNAYEGQNQDEINELADKNALTFIGDFANNKENFQKPFGYLNVVRHSNDLFTVFQYMEGTNEKLPYVLVPYIPKNHNSFISWVNEFKWERNLYEKLLPKFNINEIIDAKLSRITDKKNLINQLCLSDKEIEEDKIFLTEKLSTINFPQPHKKALQALVDDMVETNKRIRDYLDKPIENFDDIDDPDPQELYNQRISKFHYFAIGVQNDDSIKWFLACTNLNSRKLKKYSYNLERYNFTLKEVTDINLCILHSNIIGRKEYFGRGELHHLLSDKRIGIIGLGAIGSLAAEALARGGAQHLTLWDGDIVEAGNICRSVYYNEDIGNAKALALSTHIKRLSPFCDVKPMGYWYEPDYSGVSRYIGGEFYGNINYNSQEKFIKELHEYDIIIDCTASNELLHFLSYAAKDVKLLSLCITNKATHLLCLSNHEGNPFEIRKHFLSSIEQDTENFYVEDIGCYSPTFLATSCDIQSLVNLCVRSIHRQIQKQGYASSVIWHYNDDGIIADPLHQYQLDNSPIKLVLQESIINKIRKMPMFHNGNMGYLLGGYNTDRDTIYVTDAIGLTASNETMTKMRKISNGIIDYIGNISVASYSNNRPLKATQLHIAEIAESKDIDTSNPLVAIVKNDGEVDFLLYIDGDFFHFI